MSEVESAAVRAGAEAEASEVTRSVGFAISATVAIVLLGISQGVHWISSDDTLTSLTVWEASGPLLVPYVVVWLLIFVTAAASFAARPRYRRMLAAMGMGALVFEALLAIAIAQRGLAAAANPRSAYLGVGITWLFAALVFAAVALGFAGSKRS